MDRFHEIQVFHAVADAGSFARAGRKLRLSPPAVTRAIASLEDRLGTRLFNRSTRHLSLTDAGAGFLETSRRIMADWETAEREVTGDAAVPSGHLNLTASVTLGRTLLAPIVSDFLESQPRISASVLLLDRVVNLVEEGIDVAVRVGHLPDSALMARKVGDVRRILVASPGYIARRGLPVVPADLRLHSIVSFTGLMPNREWRYGGAGQQGHITLQPRLEINDATAAMAAAERGDGITIALSYMVAQPLREGRLVQVLEAFTLPVVPVHLVHPHSRLVAPKVRAFLDHAAPRLRSLLEDAAL
ncbi:MAG: hypothetical protein RLY86_62 [Pseudomonadota bacterium]|jgi:DNA-binding transcriptional LysR family regulator